VYQSLVGSGLAVWFLWACLQGLQVVLLLVLSCLLAFLQEVSAVLLVLAWLWAVLQELLAALLLVGCR
jgi:hypothetical protein